MPTILQENDTHALVDTGAGKPVKVAKTPETEKLLASLRTADAQQDAPEDDSALEGQDQPADAPGQVLPGNPAQGPFAPLREATFDAREEAAQAPERALAAAPSTPEAPPAPPSLAQTGLELTGQGFEQQQKAMEAAKGAIDQGAKAGIAEAAKKVAYMKAADDGMKAVANQAIQDNAIRQKAVNDHLAAMDAAREEYAKSSAIDPGRLWRSQSGWQQALAGVAMVLGGAGGALAGQKNGALEVINTAIERDIKAQEAQQNKLKNVYEMAREGYGDARQALLDSQSNYTFQKLIRMDDLGRYLDRITTQYQGSNVAAQAQQLKAQIDMAAGQLKQEQGQLYLSTLPNPSTIKPEQWKAADFANRMQQAHSAVSDLQKQGFDGTGLMSSARAALPEAAQSEQRKQFEQAKLSFVAATLREDAGRLTPEIIKRTEKQYFPQVGDTPKVKQQKALAREQAIQDAKLEAGWAMRFAPVVQPPPVPAGFQPVR